MSQLECHRMGDNVGALVGNGLAEYCILKEYTDHFVHVVRLGWLKNVSHVGDKLRVI